MNQDLQQLTTTVRRLGAALLVTIVMILGVGYVTMRSVLDLSIQSAISGYFDNGAQPLVWAATAEQIADLKAEVQRFSRGAARVRALELDARALNLLLNLPTGEVPWVMIQRISAQGMQGVVSLPIERGDKQYYFNGAAELDFVFEAGRFALIIRAAQRAQSPVPPAYYEMLGSYNLLTPLYRNRLWGDPLRQLGAVVKKATLQEGRLLLER